MDLLQQVAPPIRVRLVRARQPFERRAIRGRRLPVPLVLRTFHSQVVSPAAIFLQRHKSVTGADKAIFQTGYNACTSK